VGRRNENAEGRAVAPRTRAARHLVTMMTVG